MYNIDLNSIKDYSAITSHVLGTKVKMKEVINKPIIVWKYEISPSVYRNHDGRPDKNYAKILFSYQSNPNKQLVVGTTSYYLIGDLQELSDKLPMKTIIKYIQLAQRRVGEPARYAYVFS